MTGGDDEPEQCVIDEDLHFQDEMQISKYHRTEDGQNGLYPIHESPESKHINSQSNISPQRNAAAN